MYNLQALTPMNFIKCISSSFLLFGDIVVTWGEYILILRVDVYLKDAF